MDLVFNATFNNISVTYL